MTLPGISAQERKYSSDIKQCFEKGYIPGIWGCGSSEYGTAVSFSDVIGASDFIVSSSIIEGFGYLFIDSLRWGKPLVARYMDITDGFSTIFEKTASFFYGYLEVPVSPQEKESLRKMYFSNIKTYSGIIERHNLDSIINQIDSILGRDNVDFSYLPVSMQMKILENISLNPSFKKEVKTLNMDTTEKIARVILQKQDFNPARAAEYFSFESFARKFISIIESFDTAKNRKQHQIPGSGEKLSEIDTESFLHGREPERAVSENLLNLFFRPEYLRLILSEK